VTSDTRGAVDVPRALQRPGVRLAARPRKLPLCGPFLFASVRLNRQTLSSMSGPRHRLRCLVTVVVAVFALGVATHAACQAIEHHDGAKDAVALCTAAVALIATIRLVGNRASVRRRVSVSWAAVVELIPATSFSVGPRTSAVWLQRFQN
jgi:hypothetical protein